MGTRIKCGRVRYVSIAQDDSIDIQFVPDLNLQHIDPSADFWLNPVGLVQYIRQVFTKDLAARHVDEGITYALPVA